MNPDDVYALLVDANPVPELGTPGSSRVAAVTPPEHRSETMLTLSRESTDQPVSRRPDRRWRLLAVAAAVIAVVTLGALVLSRDDPEPEVPAGPVVTTDDTLPAPLTREEQAVAVASAFYRTAHSGDVDTVIEMSNTQYGGNLDADRRMWEMIAVTGELGDRSTIGDCGARPGANALYVEVDCEMISYDPVWIALGVSEVVSPAFVFDDGTVAWQAWDGADWRAAQRAYSEYVRAFHADEYGEACDPAAYEPGAVTVSEGLALTPECAELWVPLGPDVVEWIADGRPKP